MPSNHTDRGRRGETATELELVELMSVRSELRPPLLLTVVVVDVVYGYVTVTWYSSRYQVVSHCYLYAYQVLQYFNNTLYSE